MSKSSSKTAKLIENQAKALKLRKNLAKIIKKIVVSYLKWYKIHNYVLERKLISQNFVNIVEKL